MPFEDSPFPPDMPPPEGDMSPVAETVIPHNRAAEEAVLSSILINPDRYFDASQILCAEDFYIHRHRWVYEVFQRLSEKHCAIDILTVCDELKNYNQLEEIGGESFLTALLSMAPSSSNVEAYARIVEAQGIRRRLLGSASEIAVAASDQKLGIDEVVETSEKSLFSILDRRENSEVQPLSKIVSDFYDELDRRTKLKGIVGIPSGFIDVDRMLGGGMQDDDLLVIAGRPGQGKSAFLSSVMLNTALVHKKKPVLFSLEMSKQQVIQRLVSMQTGVQSQAMRSGLIEDEQWPLITHSVEVLGDLHAFIDDTPCLTPSQLRHKARRLVLEWDIDLIMVDYLQLMPSGIKSENRVQEVSYVTQQLKNIARELKVPVLVAAQLSRAVEQRTDKRPILSDLRESGAIEQTADVVMFIYRPDQYEKDTVQQNVAEIIIAKHRNGPTGSAELVFLSHLTKFVDAANRSVV